MSVGTDGHKGGMTQTGQSRKADRDHQSQPGNGIDKDKGHLTDIKLIQNSGCDQ